MPRCHRTRRAILGAFAGAAFTGVLTLAPALAPVAAHAQAARPVPIPANTLRANPAFDAAGAITELGVGEALISLLDEKGRPSVVERAFIAPPASRIGPLSAAERQALI